jgi:hypothetical protein
MEYHWYDFVGNIGVSLILIAYFLLQTEILNSKSVKFSILNLIGAFLSWFLSTLNSIYQHF